MRVFSHSPDRADSLWATSLSRSRESSERRLHFGALNARPLRRVASASFSRALRATWRESARGSPPSSLIASNEIRAVRRAHVARRRSRTRQWGVSAPSALSAGAPLRRESDNCRIGPLPASGTPKNRSALSGGLSRVARGGAPGCSITGVERSPRGLPPLTPFARAADPLLPLLPAPCPQLLRPSTICH